MKIAHVVRQYSPSIGGLEDYVENLAQAQRDNGYSVRVVTLNTCFQSGDELPVEEWIDGIEVKRVRWFGSKRYAIAPGISAHLRDVDIVHVHALDFFVDYLSLLKMLRVIKQPLIFSTHGGIFHTRRQAALKRIWFDFITRFSLRNFDEVICCSGNDFELFSAIRRQLRLVHNGVVLQKFGAVTLRSDASDFVYLGRFSENKNLFDLIGWFARFAAQNPGMKLHIVGRSETGDVKALRACIAKHGGEQAVDICADLEIDGIRELMSRCRYVVSASSYEGFGLSILELMSYGMTPLLSDIPSFRSFVEGSGCGELFALNEPAFCAAAKRLIAADKTREQPHSKPERYAQEFSWSHVWLKISEVYRVAIA